MKKPEASLTPLEKCHDSPEESGWTTYLEDFCKQSSELSYCSSFATPSLVSDATSRYPGHDTAAAFPDMPSTNLIVIKRMRTDPKVSHEEESLEDTASSPVHHSPKVDEFKSIGTCMKKNIDDDQNSVGLLYGKCGNSYYHETTTNKSTEIMFVGRSDYEFTSLKKRRLCLVPLSLLSNYDG